MPTRNRSFDLVGDALSKSLFAVIHCFSSSKLVCKWLNIEKSAFNPDINCMAHVPLSFSHKFLLWLINTVFSNLIAPPFSQEYTSLLASGELKEKQSAKVKLITMHFVFRVLELKSHLLSHLFLADNFILRILRNLVQWTQCETVISLSFD